MSTNEYANKRAIVAAGLSPVPEVGDEVLMVDVGRTFDVTPSDVKGPRLMTRSADFMSVCRLIRRGSTVIPEEPTDDH